MRGGKRGWRWYTVVGLIVTAAYLGWIIVHSNYDTIQALKPSDLGTFLGGVAGPPAFLWLVLGFFQQGEELRHSARALELQSEELRSSVQQQEALVSVTREQIDHERAERDRADQESERQAQPRFGVQRSGVVHAGGARTYAFTLANAGAPCSSVELMEGETSYGQAAVLPTGGGLDLSLHFDVGEALRDRVIELRYTDARASRRSVRYVFPAVNTAGGDEIGQPYEERETARDEHQNESR